MQNNLSPKIALQTGSNKKSRFNLSHDVTTTFDFGTTQPVMCQEMIPGSKVTLDMQALFRASPLVAPLFGRQKVEYRSFFVPVQSIMRHFQDSLLSQKAVAEGNDLKTFTEVPKIKPWELLSCLLIGSRCSIYDGRSGTASNLGSTALSLSNATTRNQAKNILDNLIKHSAIPVIRVDNSINNDFGLYHGDSRINITHILGLEDYSLWIPISSGVGGDATNGYTNIEKGFFFGSPDASVDDGSNDYDFGAVPLETADFIIEKKFLINGSNEIYTFAFSLSDAGKRLRKILLGLGYQTDFYYKEDFSLMPLFAYYMAYFDAFGLERFENFQTTNCAKCLTLFNNTATQPAQNMNNVSFRGFIYDLMNCWATQPQDFVGSIQDTVTISPSAAASYAELIEVTGDILDPSDEIPITSVDTSAESSTIENGHSYINNVIHGNLDSELLKRLYKWVNRNTVIGKRVEEILRAQGLGGWIDSQKTHFIGKHE
ncbi:MAG: major capsid protein, partial [Candidatus Bilamarchaeaceae archaeon]